MLIVNGVTIHQHRCICRSHIDFIINPILVMQSQIISPHHLWDTPLFRNFQRHVCVICVIKMVRTVSILSSQE